VPNIQILSPEGIKFIQNFEGFRDKPYRDSGGLLTIGYGNRITEEEAINFANGITQAEAQNLFDAYTVGMVTQLRKCPLALLPHQFDAICSLAYNIGLHEFLASTIYKQLSVRSVDVMSWLFFCKDAKGHLDDGLARRRRLELKLFIYGLYN
jgi:GH24 family phage-related lysozyme (muramidase)